MPDLRSDTFTQPTPAMREHISRAEVGDDYYGEDKSANRLEDYCKELFGKEAAIFTTSGMLSNQLAVATQVTPGNEVVTEYNYHLNLYESAQYASLCGVLINGRETKDGVLSVADVVAAINSKPREDVYAQVELVTVENTINHRQGKIFPFAELQALREFTSREGLRLHMDGARLFHAHVANGIALDRYAQQADTVNVCFSKGLGAPFGSMLLGPREVVEKARRLRVWHGSGFHQIGIYAAAAHYALTHHLESLAEDHRLTQLLAKELARRTDLGIDPAAIETNMIFIDLAQLGCDAVEFETRCRDEGLLLLGFPPRMARLVICRNVTEAEVLEAADVLVRVTDSFISRREQAGHHAQRNQKTA